MIEARPQGVVNRGFIAGYLQRRGTMRPDEQGKQTAVRVEIDKLAPK